MSIIIGHIGSDAGYTVIGSDGSVHHVGGWAEGQLEDFAAAVRVLEDAARIKSPGVAEGMLKGARSFIEKELAAHVQSDGATQVVLLMH